MFTLIVFVIGVGVGSVAHSWLAAEKIKLVDEVKAELQKAKPSIAALRTLIGRK